MELTSTYNPTLVSFSIFIAVIAAYTALELTERISEKGKIKLSWLIGSSLTMGTGVWAMHFVGMLAYSIGVPINYDLTTVIISWCPAIIASGMVFYYLERGFNNWFELLWAGTLMGSGIGAMHYIGMVAMRVPAVMHYDYSVVALSVVFAVILSSVSLATANFVLKKFKEREEMKIAGSFLMGTAISGMHYIGMAAAHFTSSSLTPTRSSIRIADTGLASTIGTVTIIIIFAALMASMREQKKDLQLMTKKLQNSYGLLETVNQQLEQRVEKRTAQLKLAKEAAEAANRAKEDFLVNISHELRTPLNTINGYTKMLLRAPNLDQSQQLNLQVVKQSGTHLLTLINDILDFSKTQVNKIELTPAPLHLPSFLSEVIGMFEIQAKEKGIVLGYQSDSDLPTGIVADSKRLRQVLLNLLGNAIKFTDIGSVNFKVSKLPNTLVNSHQITMRFEVSDTGVGMSKDALSKIFQPFEQVGDRTSRNKGTGLGLSISSKLVELMGSKICVKSELGKGTTFWFDVTFDLVQLKIDQQKQQLNLSKIVGYQGNHRVLLVVDDRSENRELLRNILTPLGFKIIEATNGNEGLEKAIDGKPDLILTDLMMPHKTGITMVLDLRKIPELKNTPIIANSASSLEIMKKKGLDAGCNVFLPKPIDEDKLLLHLQEYLNLEWIYKENK
ncbi:MAG: MHYT domain-containing protein [Prochloraceae cyanobacterium]|nr:MHYT domain-containing protein [Prochloraceae cyanobacterium]